MEVFRLPLVLGMSLGTAGLVAAQRPERDASDPLALVPGMAIPSAPAMTVFSPSPGRQKFKDSIFVNIHSGATGLSKKTT